MEDSDKKDSMELGNEACNKMSEAQKEKDLDTLNDGISDLFKAMLLSFEE